MIHFEFLDLLAWMQCPMARSVGYAPVHPRGNLERSRQVLDAWPNDARPLSKITHDRRQAVRWMQGTRFGASAMMSGPKAPPPAQQELGYWVRDTRPHPWVGHLTLLSNSNPDQAIHVRFELPYLTQVNGLWEIVMLDTNLDPPGLARRGDLMVEAAFLSGCFHLLTGEYAGLRLVAPGYEREEILEVPLQHTDLVIELIAAVHPVAFIRPGAHCNQVIEVNKYTKQRHWRCPARQAGQCSPFFDVPVPLRKPT